MDVSITNTSINYDVSLNSTQIDVNTENTNDIDVSVSSTQSIDVSVATVDNLDITLYQSQLEPESYTELQARAEIEDLYKVAYSTKYSEYTYTGSNLTKIEIYTDSGKATKLFTKDLSYTGSQLTSITITDELTGNTLTKTLGYSGDSLITKTEVYP